MTKTIKIHDKCNKCGTDVLFVFNLMRIKGVSLEFYAYIKHNMCKECSEKFVNLVRFYYV